MLPIRLGLACPVRSLPAFALDLKYSLFGLLPQYLGWNLFTMIHLDQNFVQRC